MPLPIRSALCPENWARFPELPQRRFTPKHNSAAYRNLSGCCRDFKSEKAKTAAVSRNQGNPRVFRTQNIKHGIPSIILCSGSDPGFWNAPGFFPRMLPGKTDLLESRQIPSIPTVLPVESVYKKGFSRRFSFLRFTPVGLRVLLYYAFLSFVNLWYNPSLTVRF